MCDSVDMSGPHVSVLTVHSPFTLFEVGSFVGLVFNAQVRHSCVSLLPLVGTLE